MLVRHLICVLLLGLVGSEVHLPAAEYSHPPMRPLPQPAGRPLAQGKSYYVDARRGNDDRDGSKQHPWQTISRALRQCGPGETVYLRGGTYYEHVVLPRSGEEGKPLTVRSYPGELAIIDGGLREFFEEPAKVWQVASKGSPHEYVSTKRYPQFSARPIALSFPAAGWEPFYGKEDQRPLVLGHFGDSMVPLHGYRTLTDLRDESMLWDVDNKFQKDEGVYCGPGLWFKRQTERIHVRLAPTSLAGLGKHAYRGPDRSPQVGPLHFRPARRRCAADQRCQPHRAARPRAPRCGREPTDQSLRLRSRHLGRHHLLRRGAQFAG